MAKEMSAVRKYLFLSLVGDRTEVDAREIQSSGNILATPNLRDNQERLQKEAPKNLMEAEHFVCFVARDTCQQRPH